MRNTRKIGVARSIDAADTDKDNAVSYDELQAHLTAKDVESQLQQYVADAGLNAQTYFEKLDANQDGKVALNEFVDGLRPMAHTCKPWKAVRRLQMSKYATLGGDAPLHYESGPTGTPTLTIEDREIY